MIPKESPHQLPLALLRWAQKKQDLGVSHQLRYAHRQFPPPPPPQLAIRLRAAPYEKLGSMDEVRGGTGGRLGRAKSRTRRAVAKSLPFRKQQWWQQAQRVPSGAQPHTGEGAFGQERASGGYRYKWGMWFFTSGNTHWLNGGPCLSSPPSLGEQKVETAELEQNPSGSVLVGWSIVPVSLILACCSLLVMLFCDHQIINYTVTFPIVWLGHQGVFSVFCVAFWGEKFHCRISLCTGTWLFFTLRSMKRRRFWRPGRKMLFYLHHQCFREWSDGPSASAAGTLFCYPRKLGVCGVPYLCCTLGLTGIHPLSSAVSVLDVTMCSTLMCLISLTLRGTPDNLGHCHWFIWSCTVAESTDWCQRESLSCVIVVIWSSSALGALQTGQKNPLPSQRAKCVNWAQTPLQRASFLLPSLLRASTWAGWGYSFSPITFSSPSTSFWTQDETYR